MEDANEAHGVAGTSAEAEAVVSRMELEFHGGKVLELQKQGHHETTKSQDSLDASQSPIQQP